VSSNESIDYLLSDQKRVGGTYIPVERPECRSRGCERSIYSNELCKLHKEMFAYGIKLSFKKRATKFKLEV